MEQPLKKRKLYEPPPPPPPSSTAPPPPPPPPPSTSPPPPPSTSPPPPPQQPPSSKSPPPPPPPPIDSAPPPQTPAQVEVSHDEVMRRRRSQEEIRGVYECYKRIKYYSGQKDPRFMQEIEQAYLSLISASRGSTSVQRVVVDHISRYAPYCPTALEAAAKVVIDMHNWSLALLNRGEDVDGKNIFQIVNKECIKIQDNNEFYKEVRKNLLKEDESASCKLSKFRAMTFLNILFNCPRYSIAACFELLESTSTEGSLKNGYYFISQLTSRLDEIVTDSLDHGGDVAKSTGYTNISHEHYDDKKDFAPGGKHMLCNAATVSRNCLLQQILEKDPRLQQWMYSRYKKFQKSAPSHVNSELASDLGEFFESLAEHTRAGNGEIGSDEDESTPSRHRNQYLVNRMSRLQETTMALSPGDSTSKYNDRPFPNDRIDTFTASNLQKSNHLGLSSADVEGARLEIDTGEHGNLRTVSSEPREFSKQQMFSPTSRTPLDMGTNLFQGGNHCAQIEKSHVLSVDVSSTGGKNSPFESPKPQFTPHRSPNHVAWLSDGDPAAMDIVPASKQLCYFLGP
ncbi:hypothetical protein Leryth_015210 [Lithospermum erythrorhizon]|nr:hypothetical protein Leryth_015210 [Lithospermum erythrorhizon]